MTVVPLVLDAAWSSDDYAKEARLFLAARQGWMVCDCMLPTRECETVCDPSKLDRRWICGTPMLRTEAALIEAIRRRVHPDVIARLLKEHPGPFEQIVEVRNYEPSLETAAQ
jgi:hypothetical protein